MKVESWGRYPRVQAGGVILSYADAPLPRQRPLLPHGLGRSYGDVCLTERGTHLFTRSCRRILAVDEEARTLRCEAGASLDEILALTVPKGLFPPVVPGTRFVTVGGAIANDIHGKNHHLVGTFGAHVLAIEVRRTTGESIRCTPSENPDLFRATVGGLGLTGLITRAELRLAPLTSPAIVRESIPFGSIQEFLDLSDAMASRPYIVGWLDCLAPSKRLGRGILFVGEHAVSGAPAMGKQRSGPAVRKTKRFPAVPMTAPSWLLNRATASAFNAAYRLAHRRRVLDVVHYEQFFFPLDAVPRWNLLYGSGGFLQWQCVVPRAAALVSVNEILETLHRSGHDAYLGVIKVFGDHASLGLLSFPRPGVTLAIDLPIRGQRTFALLDALDTIVAREGGAIYPAKDARMSPDMFRRSYPRLNEFIRHRDPGLRSLFWDRVVGPDAP